MNRCGKKEFRAVNTLCDDTMMATHHYTECTYTTSSEPLCTLWTLGDCDVTVQVHPWGKLTVPVTDTDNGESMPVRGLEAYGKFLCFPLKFCCEPKTALKNKDFKKGQYSLLIKAGTSNSAT